MLSQFTEWLVSLVKASLAALWTFLTDLFIALVEMIVGGLVALLSLIPVPGFMSGGLQSVYGMLDPAILYLLAASGVPAALTIIGAAYLFRIGRKVATLFQW